MTMTTGRLAGLRAIKPRRPDRTVLAAAAPIVFALSVLAVAASSGLRERLGWVPVEHDNSVVDALLTVVVAIVFLVVAAVVVLPLSLVLHQAGHAVAGPADGDAGASRPGRAHPDRAVVRHRGRDPAAAASPG
jgi:fumarate reductase subunit D